MQNHVRSLINHEWGRATCYDYNYFAGYVSSCFWEELLDNLGLLYINLTKGSGAAVSWAVPGAVDVSDLLLLSILSFSFDSSCRRSNYRTNFLSNSSGACLRWTNSVSLFISLTSSPANVSRPGSALPRRTPEVTGLSTTPSPFFCLMRSHLHRWGKEWDRLISGVLQRQTYHIGSTRMRRVS